MRNDQRVAIVTVTYGRRWNYLSQMIEEVLRQGAVHVLIIDNGCPAPIADAIPEHWRAVVTSVRLPVNAGSAQGFATALREVRRIECDYVLVLDDDNVPAPGAIDLMIEKHQALSNDAPPDKIMVAGNRISRRSLATVVETQRAFRSGDAFLGFRVLDLPRKVLARLKRGRPVAAAPADGLLPVISAPYGGLMVKPATLANFDGPQEQLILYADDVEYTARFNAGGGRIYIVLDAIIKDLEDSWNTAAGRGSAMSGWLEGSSDARAYYAARNHVYVEKRFASHRPLARRLNKFAYLTCLYMLARRSGKMERFRLILTAVEDGEAFRLGPHASYKL